MKALLKAAAMVVIAGSVVACTAKGTVTREYNKDGKIVKESRHQRWELLPGLKITPGQIFPNFPGTIDFPSAPEGGRPVILPDGRPGIIFPNDPSHVYPVQLSATVQSSSVKSANYVVDVNINDLTCRPRPRPALP
ncbi:MAG: hypothetical protein EBZ48_00755 [Proteobacteria bacterium]|nr:hypothetical protein [Pseudomonadota bacterium]